MSKNVIVNGTTYNGVSTVQLNTSNGGTASFKDTDEIITPTGTKEITANGTYDVTNYASAEVNIESGNGEDFVGIKYSNFDPNRGSPNVADIRTLPYDKIANNGGYKGLFKSNTTNSNAGWHALLEEVYVSDLATEFSAEMFLNCTKLNTIHGNLANLVTIGVNTFENCTSLVEAPYMPNIETVYGNAFKGCTNLTSFKFYKTPSSIVNTAFSNCTNLLDIYVPWAEGEVANAPWGATNATIHYNTTYDENHNPII